MMTAMLPEPLQAPVKPVARMMMRSMTPDDPTDLLATLDAEDAFDIEDRLHGITAPTLVVGGAKDIFYSTHMFQQTADGVQDGRAHIQEDWGHVRTAASSATADLTLGFMLACRRG
jgi:pimeloyl-ACP methyl ester carboxylesterase